MPLKLVQFRYYGENNPIKNNFPLLFSDRLTKVIEMQNMIANDRMEILESDWKKFQTISKGVINWGAKDNDINKLYDDREIAKIQDENIKLKIRENQKKVGLKIPEGQLEDIDEYGYSNNEKKQMFLLILDEVITFLDFKEMDRKSQKIFLYIKEIIFRTILEIEKENGMTVLWPEAYSFQKYGKLQYIKIQTIPGTKIYMKLNENADKSYIIGDTGILEINVQRNKIENDSNSNENQNYFFRIKGFSLDAQSKKTINALEDGHLIITIIYSEGE